MGKGARLSNFSKLVAYARGLARLPSTIHASNTLAVRLIDSPTTRELVLAALTEGLKGAGAQLGWGEAALTTAVALEHPAEKSHGDYATNVAMLLAKPLKQAPLEIANAIASHVPLGGVVGSVEVAGRGFINVRLDPTWLAKQVDVIVSAREGFGRTSTLAGQKIQVEFISANPTGPMTIANARGGPIGDVLANVLAFHGASVTREYYVNDGGGQVDMLGQSVAVRYRELGGDTSVPFPVKGYPASYITDIAKQIRDQDGAAYESLSFDKQSELFTKKAQAVFVEGFKVSAALLGVRFDSFFFESDLVASGYVQKTLDTLRSLGALEDRDGAVWLRSKQLGEDIESVVIRSSGLPTYFGVDIAYHRHAFLVRGFDKKIDIWGANTHGHLRRMKTALTALGLLDRWDAVLYQYVKFLNQGVLLKMGKRLNQFLLLDDVITAIGKDVTRWFFLTSSADSTMDFDFNLAVKQSSENPAYYVQYAHARIAGVIRTAADKNLTSEGADVALLTDAAELDLVRLALRFPELVEEIRVKHNVHLLTSYAAELAGAFHSFYKSNRVISDDVPRSKARLRLVESVGLTLRQTLGLLGVSAPKTM